MICQKKEIRLRHELKHIINAQDVQELSSRLSKLFERDKHSGADGLYRVTSLYFDTLYDKALRQKIDGVNEREKFRLRFYNGDTSWIRLEKKIKIHGLCGKYTAAVTYEQVQKLLEGKADILLESEEPLLLEFYSKIRGQLLQPQTIVEYDREAFLYRPGNVRVTLDSNLRTGFYNRDFLSPDRISGNISENQSVLEVKYDAFLPEIVRMAVQMPGRRAEAFSKYAVCRQYD